MAALSDILTSAQNIVTAINQAAQTYINVNGAQNYPNISTATVVSPTAGRLVQLSITTKGSAVGTIYDTASASSTANPIFTIPNTLGIIRVNLPVSNGIVVAPGTSQVVTVSFS